MVENQKCPVRRLIDGGSTKILEQMTFFGTDPNDCKTCITGIDYKCGVYDLYLRANKKQNLPEQPYMGMGV